MNILQKFLQLENNDILNKIYNYLGKHPIVEKTRLKDAITTYTMRLNSEPYNTFSNFYFKNLRNVRKNKKERLRHIKYRYRELNYGFYNVTYEYNDLLFYYDNDLLFDYEESNNLKIFSNFYFYNLKIYKLIDYQFHLKYYNNF